MTFTMADASTAATRYVPKRKNDPAATRARILDAGYALFQEQGYNATSVHDIAARASVTGGAFHHHFPTKKALGLAVIAERVAPDVEETWLEPLRSTDDVRDTVVGIFETIARQLDLRGTVHGCPVNNLTLELALADLDYRAELRRLFDRWRDGIAAKLTGHDADRRAAMAVAAFSGAMAVAKVEQRGEPLRLAATELERIL